MPEVKVNCSKHTGPGVYAWVRSNDSLLYLDDKDKVKDPDEYEAVNRCLSLLDEKDRVSRSKPIDKDDMKAIVAQVNRVRSAILIRPVRGGEEEHQKRAAFLEQLVKEVTHIEERLKQAENATPASAVPVKKERVGRRVHFADQLELTGPTPAVPRKSILRTAIKGPDDDYMLRLKQVDNLDNYGVLNHFLGLSEADKLSHDKPITAADRQAIIDRANEEIMRVMHWASADHKERTAYLKALGYDLAMLKNRSLSAQVTPVPATIRTAPLIPEPTRLPTPSQPVTVSPPKGKPTLLKPIAGDAKGADNFAANLIDAFKRFTAAKLKETNCKYQEGKDFSYKYDPDKRTHDFTFSSPQLCQEFLNYITTNKLAEVVAPKAEMQYQSVNKTHELRGKVEEIRSKQEQEPDPDNSMTRRPQ